MSVSLFRVKLMTTIFIFIPKRTSARKRLALGAVPPNSDAFSLHLLQWCPSRSSEAFILKYLGIGKNISLLPQDPFLATNIDSRHQPLQSIPCNRLNSCHLFPKPLLSLHLVNPEIISFNRLQKPYSPPIPLFIQQLPLDSLILIMRP